MAQIETAFGPLTELALPKGCAERYGLVQDASGELAGHLERISNAAAGPVQSEV